MLQIDAKMRDEIVRVLQQLLAPATSGHTIMQIANLLSNLKEVEKPKPNVEPTNL